MRQLTDHKVNGLNEAIDIEVLDAPGQGGASHVYDVAYQQDGVFTANFSDKRTHLRVQFQNGAIKEAGVNGISQEALLAIVIDRLRSFQAGPFACRDNAVALTKLEEALMWLQKRTRERMARGVEGTNQK